LLHRGTKILIGQFCQIDSLGFSQRIQLRFLSPFQVDFLFLLSVIYKALTISVGGILSKIKDFYITKKDSFLHQTDSESFS